MKPRNLIVAIAAVGIVVGGALWRTHSGGGETSILVGPLRVISASASTTLPTPGLITEQQAVATVVAKLADLEPTIAWTTAAQQPTVRVTQIPNMTSVTKANNGHVLYTRTRAINAWVVEIALPPDVTGVLSVGHGGWGFGIVSNSTYTPVTCKADGCDPPGTLLNAQAFITP